MFNCKSEMASSIVPNGTLHVQMFRFHFSMIPDAKVNFQKRILISD